MNINLFEAGDKVAWLRNGKVCTGEVRAVLGRTHSNPPRLTVYEDGSARVSQEYDSDLGYITTPFYCVVTQEQNPQKPL